MKISLKVKLTISYVLISLFLVFSLLFAARYMINNQFEYYVKKNQNENARLISEQVVKAFKQAEGIPSNETLINIGDMALEKGFILRIYNTSGNMIWCMDLVDNASCGTMLHNIENNMKSIYPNFDGKYVETNFLIKDSETVLGTINLGHYGPFYFGDSEVQFLKIMNQVFLFGAIAALFIAICLGFLMASRITRPIHRIIDQTHEMEQGKYKHLIDISTNTLELSTMIQSVNSLATTLERQSIIRKNLARNYAHEIRTPLASLRSNLEAMIDGIWEPTKERLESCNEEILRLTRMIGDIDKLVAIEDENLILTKEKFDLLELIHQITMNFDSLLLEKKIDLIILGKSSMIYADKDKIGQVLINLISNGIKYSNDYGKIIIQINQDKEKTELIIEDTGIGMAQEELPLIFEHLYRTDKSRSSSTGGSGIGLAVVKAIIDAHNGKISVTSALGKGSTFLVSLPNNF